MYTTIGFLSPKIAIQKIQDNLKDLHSDSSSQESSDNTILDTDTVIYAIKNTEEMSYIEFHVKTLENNLFIHHDIFVTDTIIAADYLESNGKHILVTGGCEKNVNLYDCFIDNMFDPLFTFKGHDSEINAIIASNYEILSGGDDCKIFKWDIDTQKQK
ncbi:rRNA-processing protein [Gurleya vavrai]